MIVFTLLATLLSSDSAFACSPPPDATYTQPSQIAQLLDIGGALGKLREIGGKDIASITKISGGYVLESSNGCRVETQTVYLPPEHPGLCPRLAPPKVLAAACE